VGCGLVGCEIAAFLAEKGRVSLFSFRAPAAPEVNNPDIRKYLLKELEENRVESYQASRNSRESPKRHRRGRQSGSGANHRASRIVLPQGSGQMMSCARLRTRYRSFTRPVIACPPSDHGGRSRRGRGGPPDLTSRRGGVMDITLTEEQEFFRKTIADAVDRLILPRTRELDEATEFPWDLGKSSDRWATLACGIRRRSAV